MRSRWRARPTARRRTTTTRSTSRRRRRRHVPRTNVALTRQPAEAYRKSVPVLRAALVSVVMVMAVALPSWARTETAEAQVERLAPAPGHAHPRAAYNPPAAPLH